MLTYLQAIILGILQGISELFPISSLGHSVLLPQLLQWHLRQQDTFFVSFLVITHLATAIVLFCFFFTDWVKIIGGLVRSFKEREIKETDTYAKIAWLLIIGTVPVGLIGILFEQQVQALFASSVITAVFLFGNGLMLLGAEILRRRHKESGEQTQSDVRIAKLSWMQAFGIGFAQAVALLPGFSRTGATLAGGLLVGLSHTDAMRFAFLLATPIIGAAALLKIIELIGTTDYRFLGPALIGALSAGIAATFAVKFLTKYFKTNTLIPFAIYCICAGAVSAAIFLFR